jgi:hypothetical protein
MIKKAFFKKKSKINASWNCPHVATAVDLLHLIKPCSGLKCREEERKRKKDGWRMREEDRRGRE